ncbi:unnamed protein product, partial [Trichogramma brassicae]
MKIRISRCNQDRWNTHYFQFRPWFCLSKITLNVCPGGIQEPQSTPGVTFKGLNSSCRVERLVAAAPAFNSAASVTEHHSAHISIAREHGEYSG